MKALTRVTFACLSISLFFSCKKVEAPIQDAPEVSGQQSRFNGITYQKVFEGPANDFTTDYSGSFDGGGIAAGLTNSFGNGQSDFDAMLLRVSGTGRLRWSKTYSVSDEDVFFKVRQTNDGGVIAFGYTTDFTALERNFLVVKTDFFGNLQWSRTFDTRVASQNKTPVDIILSDDGGYIIAGQYDLESSTQIFLARLSARGNVSWSRSYPEGVSAICKSVIESNGSIVVAGNLFQLETEEQVGFLMRVDSYTGKVSWVNQYTQPGNRYDFMRVERRGSGFSVFAQATDINDDFAAIRPQQIRVNGRGQVINANSVVTSTIFYDIASYTGTRDGGAIISQGEGGNPSNVHLFRLNAQGQTVWQKKFPRPEYVRLAQIVQTADGAFNGGGIFNDFFTTSDADVFMMRTDRDGNTGSNDNAANNAPAPASCPSIGTDALSQSVQPITVALNWARADINVLVLTNKPVTVKNVVFKEKVFCASSGCYSNND
jgi:hypothetical protein